MATLHNLVLFLLVISLLAIASSIVVLIALLFRYISAKTAPSRRAFILIVIMVVVPVLLLKISASVLKEKARNDVLSKVLYCQHGDCSVYVGGKILADNAKSLLDDISRLENHQYHNSHPGEKKNISIRSALWSVDIILARDSQHNDEYWVFFPEFYFTRNNDIGTVRTEILKDDQ